VAKHREVAGDVAEQETMVAQEVEVGAEEGSRCALVRRIG
jgi:hypothetical protein